MWSAKPSLALIRQNVKKYQTEDILSSFRLNPPASEEQIRHLLQINSTPENFINTSNTNKRLPESWAVQKNTMGVETLGIKSEYKQQ